MNIKSFFQTAACICLCSCLFLACSGLNDENGKNNEANYLIGSWESFKLEYYENGVLDGSREDDGLYFQFKENGEGYGRMYGPDLIPFTWTRNGDVLSFNGNTGDIESFKIVTLSREFLTLELDDDGYCERWFLKRVEGIPEEDNSDIVTQGAVDLGLSVKWAASNLGALSPEKSGDYYAWGELEPYYSSLEPSIVWKQGKSKGYCYESYRWTLLNGEYGTYFSKYNDKDGKTVLAPEDDAAHVQLGGNWRMPTMNEFDELRNNCNEKGVTFRGVNGIKFTSRKNGKSIFFPFNGRFSGTDLSNTEEIWLFFSTRNNFYDAVDYTHLAHANSSVAVNPEADYRTNGLAIRPVCQE